MFFLKIVAGFVGGRRFSRRVPMNITNTPRPSASKKSPAARLLAAGVCAASLFTAAGLNAATITFYSPVTGLNDTSSLDTPLSFSEATLVQAVNFGSGAGSGAQSVVTSSQTVAFTAGTISGNAVSGTATTLFNSGAQGGVLLSPTTTGNTQFDNVLKSDGWHSQNTDATRPLTLQIGNLTIGQTYVVTLFSADARVASAGRTQQYFDTFLDGVFSGGSSSSFSQNLNTSVMGTFVADATTQRVFIHATDAVGANDDTTLSGFTLYSVAAIPEPSSFAALAGLAGLGFAASRRRRAAAPSV